MNIKEVVSLFVVVVVGQSRSIVYFKESYARKLSMK